MAARASIQRFRVLEKLGSGAMGTVYRAHDPQLDRVVAIKVLNEAPAPARDELSTHRTIDLRDRADASSDELLQEARIMARLAHPNVVPVFEVGLDGAAVFVVMEHVDGEELRQWLEQARAPHQILDAFAQAARGLEAAHACGIVHRDFKPANVLIGRDGRVRVADFGLSRLIAPAEALKIVVDAAGTPRYMAPEQWAGRQATARSDVFSFCVALVEALGADPRGERAEVDRALRKRGVATAVRELALRGLAEDAAARPPIGELAAALTERRISRRALAIGAAVAIGAAGVGVAAAIASAEDPEAACAEAPSVLADHWDADRRARLRARLVDGGGPEAERAAAAFLAGVDGHASAIDDADRGACSARARGELTAAQAAQRRSCLERRAFEFGATIARALAAPERGIAAADETFRTIASYPAVTPCGEFEPPRGDRRDIAALYTRFGTARDLPDKPRLVEMTAIEKAARELGDAELETRAAIDLGYTLRVTDEVAASGEAIERAHARALAISHASLVAVALMERSRTLEQQADLVGARSVAKLSAEFAARPAVAPRTRSLVYRVLGRAETTGGDYIAGIATFRKALAIAQSGALMKESELLIMIDLADAVIASSGAAQAEGLALAQRTCELARSYSGARSINYAVGLELLADSHAHSGKLEEALAIYRESLAIMLEVAGPDHSRSLHARVGVAHALADVGRVAEARRELEQLARVETDERERVRLSCLLADVTFDAGDRALGVQRGERCLEVTGTGRGVGHPHTLEARARQIARLLEIDQIDEAERRLAALGEAYRERREPLDRINAIQLTAELATEIAFARGRPRDAEALARRALAELAEAGAPDAELRVGKQQLGRSLVEQQRFAEALPPLDEALAIAQARQVREDGVARIELELAGAYAGLGRRDDAAHALRRAVERLDRWPAQVIARKRAAKLAAASKLLAQPSPSRPPRP